MNMMGLVKNSFVDYRGRVAAAVFTPLCNLNCYYCHNSWLIPPPTGQHLLSAEKVLAFLNKRKGLLEGVVVSGGEPLLQEGLDEFLASVKELGFYTKLDTNGTQPSALLRLLTQNLLDCVAMDLKAPFNRYLEITGIPVEEKTIRESIRILLSSSVEVEFKTTVVPLFSLEDIGAMARSIDGAACYVLQQFRKPAGRDRLIDMRNHLKPHNREFFNQAADLCRRHVRLVETRGF